MINVLLNLCLFTIKFIGGKISCSVAIISDAYNNLSDAISTLFSWFGLKISTVGEGEHHPNGHGRFEWVITLISSISIILIGWELLRDSIQSIKTPSAPVFSWFTLCILIISIGIKFFMFLFNNGKSKKQNSPSLKAIAIDCMSDALSTTVVLVSLIVYTIFKINIDGWCGILVSLFIIYNGFTSSIETIEMIMGQSAPQKELEEVKNLILSNKHFIGVNNIQIENYGNNRYRLSGIVTGSSKINSDDLLKDMADMKLQIIQKYGYKISLSLEKEFPINDSINSYVDSLLGKISVPLVKQSVRVVEGNSRKILYLTLGLKHEDFSKMPQAENDISKLNLEGKADLIVVPELRLVRDENNRHGPKNSRN